MAAAAVMAPLASMFPENPAVPSSSKSSDLESSKFGRNQTSNLLVDKIAAVLRNIGYDDNTVEKVSSRVETNIVEANNIPADDFLGDSDSLSHFVSTELLDERKLRQKNLYLNSNEPVLLLEASKDLELEPAQIHSLKDDLLLVLRAKSIKPVRVYIRLVEEAERPHLGVTLLNVVNTDIGGPSMVQLLDAGFHGEGWQQELVLKEAWNGYDLLWRDEAGSGTRVEAQQVVDEMPAEQQQERDSMTVVADASANTRPEEGQPSQTNPSPYKDASAVPEDEEDVEPEVIEHPAMKELREREAKRPGVQHPTWSRTQDDPGLLDMITTHPSSAKDTDPISVIKGHQSESEEGEYEVVEKV